MSISVDNLQPVLLTDMTSPSLPKGNSFMSDMDKNQDGFITADEVITSVRFFDTKDSDQDGIVTVRETLQYLNENPSRYIIQPVVPKASSDTHQTENTSPIDTEGILSHILNFLVQKKNEKLEQGTLNNLIHNQKHLGEFVEILSEDNDLSVLA